MKRRAGALFLALVLVMISIVPYAAEASDTQADGGNIVQTVSEETETESESETETETETEPQQSEPDQGETSPGEDADIPGEDEEGMLGETAENPDEEETLTSEETEEEEPETKPEEEPEADEEETKADDDGYIPGTIREEDPTLHPVQDASEVAESITGFAIDISSYPPADTSENTKLIYKYLTKELGMNHAAACGVLANIQLESGFNQFALGDGGTSYGICQWHAERFSRLMSFCNGTGYDYNTLEGQLEYLAEELSGSYLNVYRHLLQVPDTAEGAYDAAYYWCVYFESPSEVLARAAQRGNLAKNEYFPLDLSLEEEDITDIRQAVSDIRRQMGEDSATADTDESFTDVVIALRQEMSESSYEVRKEKALQAVADLRSILDAENN